MALPPAPAAAEPVSTAPMPATVAERLAVALAGLERGRAALPPVPARRVFFLAADLDAALPGLLRGAAPLDLMMPESFDFWRHPPGFYARFAAVTLLLPAARKPARGRLAALYAQALGRAPALRWLAPEHPEP